MEIIKRKILLENSIDRNYDSKTWGKLSADTFFINIFLKQSIDDMGLFSDIDIVPKTENGTVNYDVLTQYLDSIGVSHNFSIAGNTAYPNPLNATPFENVTLRYPSATVDQFYNYGGNTVLTGATDSKLEDLKSYKRNNQYPVNFVINSETYTNFEGVSIDGVDLVSSYAEPIVYVFDTPQDQDLGTNNQEYGIQYLDYSGITRNSVITGDRVNESLTIFRFKKQGWNETNTSLSAITKEEYLFSNALL